MDKVMMMAKLIFVVVSEFLGATSTKIRDWKMVFKFSH
jgi:hypothetical protein